MSLNRWRWFYGFSFHYSIINMTTMMMTKKCWYNLMMMVVKSQGVKFIQNEETITIYIFCSWIFCFGCIHEYRWAWKNIHIQKKMYVIMFISVWISNCFELFINMTFFGFSNSFANKSFSLNFWFSSNIYSVLYWLLSVILTRVECDLLLNLCLN